MSARREQDLRRRLSRLGRGDRRKPIESPSIPGHAAKALGGLPGGELIETPLGPCYCIENHYAVDHVHGATPLASVLDFDPALAAEVARDRSLAEASIKHLVFLDTETTGLAGGAGTLVFLVGIGTFTEEDFVLRQFFLRDPGEESGMLEALRQDLEAASGFVTFNGRAFDLPLLQMRYVVGLRQRLPITRRPHLDLLHPARRLWRRELPDCTLGTIERRVLGISRTDEDVPGAEIPGMYLDYLRSGDASQMARVVYHNAVDILSLVGLTTEILVRHQDTDPSRLSGSEALAVARWHERQGRGSSADVAYQAAVEAEDQAVASEALRRWTSHLKHEGRHEDAAVGWEAWQRLAPDDPRPCIELAKHAEWRTHDLAAAERWAQAALVSLSHWPPGWRRDRSWQAVEHRLERLARKREKARGD